MKMLRIISHCKVALFITALMLCFQASSYAADITLRWDANTEPDLAGYNVSYRAGSSGGGILGNYNGTGAIEGSSPITMVVANDENVDPDIVDFTLHNLSSVVTYFFVVTAYDSEGLESDYSDEVAASPETTALESAIGAGGDAGGGCFIATAAFGSDMDRYVQILRKFRDNRLLTNQAYRVLVDLYYQLPPPGAVSDGLKVYWSHDLRQL